MTAEPRPPHDADQPLEEDVISDPALDDTLGSDWSDEGGATPGGPATTVPDKGSA